MSVYHGERARYHYFQCLQLILRMQIVALVKAWDLPPEFEVRLFHDIFIFIFTTEPGTGGLQGHMGLTLELASEPSFSGTIFICSRAERRWEGTTGRYV